MNYREKMRKAIECPQFGNIHYGEWGSLRLDQRKDIKRLLDEMDRADEVVKHQHFEIERLNNIIEGIDDIIKNHYIVGHTVQNASIDSILKEIKELKEGR